MKVDRIDPAAAPATLQDVLDRLVAAPGLSETRKRDLRSAVVTFAKLTDQAPVLIPLDLASIRAALDAMVPAQAKVSRKRWANLRSDLAAAIEVAGLRPMLKTAGVALDETWSRLISRLPTDVCAMVCRVLPAGRACAGSIRRPSTPPPSGAGDGWFIVIPCTETKTNTPIEFAVPELLRPYLATYLNVVRPTIAPAAVQCAMDKPEGRRPFLFRDLGDHYSAYGQTAWRPHRAA